MEWSFQREEGISVIPEGAHRIRIHAAEKTQSQSGKDMIKFQFDVSGHAGYLFHNIVFLPDRPEITNRNLTQLFDSFKDIKEGDLNIANWIGKVGACMVKHEEYKGEQQARVNYFIRADRQGDLKPWEEPKRKESTDGNGSTGNVATDADGFVQVPDEVDEMLPF